MHDNNQQSLVGYFFSIALAMALNIFYFPPEFSYLNPDWVLLILIYWVLTVPEAVGIFNAWGVGLLLDVLTGRLLGLNSLTYSLICYCCLIFHQQLKGFLLIQQTIFIFFCLLFSQIMKVVLESSLEKIQFTLDFFYPAVTGAIIWLLAYVIVRAIQLVR